MYEISEKLINKLGNYLARKPYIEVVDLVSQLQKLEKVKKEKKKNG